MRCGDAIHFNDSFLNFAAHYHFEPRPVAVARGNEKGRVERSIRYARENFFAARTWKDLDDLNTQADHWCEEVASLRPCPEESSITVREAFMQEQSKLLALPNNPYPVDERVEVSVGKTPYVRFDLNDYSVPHRYVRRILTVVATLKMVSILDGTTLVAEHPRSYDKGQQIEQEAHIKELVEYKRHARLHRNQDRLTHAVPSSSTLLNQAAKAGYSLRAITNQLVQLLECYGHAELEIAIKEALSRNVPHPNAVRLSLEKRREEANIPPPLPLELQDQRIRDLVVPLHSLEHYDQLHQEKNDHDD